MCETEHMDGKPDSQPGRSAVFGAECSVISFPI